MGRTNIDLDDQLVREGLRIFNCKSKRELIHLALKEILKSAKQKEILELRGKVKREGDLGVETEKHRKLIKRYSGKAKPGDFSHS